MNRKKGQKSDSIFKKLFGVQDANAALKQAYAGLADVEIKTGHKKTGLFGWGSGKDIYSSILSVYPQLVDANGKFDKELAGTIINTREMSDESKNALQNMINLAQQAEEAYEALNDYMTDIFGDLGGSMSDALVDAFRNGTDAAQSFTDSVSNMLETLAKQMIYSVTLAPIIEKAQKQMMDVMQNVGLSDEQKFKQWTGILDGLVDGAIEQQGYANSLYEKFKQAAADKGFDIFSPDKDTSQSSTKGGFATASQDSISELNGRFTAGQIVWEETKNQAIEQTSLLSSINEKMSLVGSGSEEGSLFTGDEPGNVSPSDGLREMFAANIVQRTGYSTQLIGQITVLTNEVVGLKGIVDEMRTKQVEQMIDVSDIADGASVIIKNIPTFLANSEATKNSCKSLAGR